MKKNKYNRSCNCNNSKIGDACNRNCSSRSDMSFEKNAGIITDNEYEINSESRNNRKNKKRR